MLRTGLRLRSGRQKLHMVLCIKLKQLLTGVPVERSFAADRLLKPDYLPSNKPDSSYLTYRLKYGLYRASPTDSNPQHSKHLWQSSQESLVTSSSEACALSVNRFITARFIRQRPETGA